MEDTHTGAFSHDFEGVKTLLGLKVLEVGFSCTFFSKCEKQAHDYIHLKAPNTETQTAAAALWKPLPERPL